MLKVLLGDVHTMHRQPAFSAAAAKGAWGWPGRPKSAWISSATTKTSWSAQTRAMASSSAGVQTRPTGLCGLQRMNMRAPEETTASSNAATSNV